MSIPMGLSTQLLSPSLAKLQLSNYFGQLKSENTSRSISTPDVSDKPTSVIKTDEKDQNSIVVVTNPHSHQKKKLSNKLNRKDIDRAIAFCAYAVEEDHQGNPDCAMELYLLGLEHILQALPRWTEKFLLGKITSLWGNFSDFETHADQSRRNALKTKLIDFMDRTGLINEFSETENSSTNQENNEPGSSKLSENIIQAAVTGAVALKQSPIPDAISATVNYTMRKIKVIDEAYGIQDKAWEISRSGINMALEIDQQYNVHEKVVNGLFLGLTAAMKAGIAYTDSPSYRELKKLQVHYGTAEAETETETALIKDVD
ncbi:15764_t:CDS:2 [Cetraspora pellucida]|uniref:15764_t:CDS:1 n=1 Tax=Cetraspora pellucida TaxID=1433469 RepID=A0ACA9K624_9GLOM|nr:15764_t:CDS:2 [Cetraspora pellucida]